MITSTNTHRSLIAGAFLVAALTFLFNAPGASAADVYSGQWNNKKFNTKGTLVATLTKGQGNQWTGVFTGIALGKNYRYTTRFTSRTQSGKLMLVGNSSIDGDTYKWAAYVVGNQLTGSYRANNGNNGNFNGRKR